MLDNFYRAEIRDRNCETMSVVKRAGWANAQVTEKLVRNGTGLLRAV
jgi:hypothetical protein